MFQSGPPPGAVYKSLGNAVTSGTSNTTEQGSKTLAVSGQVPAGESVWLMGLLQALGANGAVVNGRLETGSNI